MAPVVATAIPVLTLYASFYALRGDAIAACVLPTYVAGGLWLVLAPVLTWWYETRALGAAEGTIHGPDGVRFHRARRVLLLPVLVLLASNYVGGLGFYETLGGIEASLDPFYLAWGLVWVGLFGYLGSIGLAIVWTELAREPGASSVVASRVGLIAYASGVLVVPKGVLMLGTGGPEGLIWAALGVYLVGFAGVLAGRLRAEGAVGARPDGARLGGVVAEVGLATLAVAIGAGGGVWLARLCGT